MPLNTVPNYQMAKKWYTQFQKNTVVKMSVSLGVSCLLILILFIVAIRPTIVTISNLKQQIEAMENLNQRLASKLTTLQKAYSQYQQIEPLVEVANKVLPANHSFPRFEAQLRFLVAKHHLALSSLSFSDFEMINPSLRNASPLPNPTGTSANSTPPSPTPGQPSNAVPAIAVSLSVEGDYQNLKNFLQDVQSLIRLTSLHQLNFLSETNANQDINLSLEGKVYFDPAQLL